MDEFVQWTNGLKTEGLIHAQRENQQGYGTQPAALGQADRGGHRRLLRRGGTGERIFFAVIEENLALPFATGILGVEASVVAVEMDDDGRLDAVCERDGERQRIGLTNLPLPSPPPSGVEWIAAYRRWVSGRRDYDEEEE
jgi:hypothetical protein